MSEVVDQTVRTKLAKAREFFDAADLIKDTLYDVTVSAAASAAINACDVLCLIGQGSYLKGDDHRQAAAALRALGMNVAAAHLLGAILNKQKSQYSARRCTASDAAAALKHAERLLKQATQEASRKGIISG